RQPAAIAGDGGDAHAGRPLPHGFHDVAGCVQSEPQRVEPAGHVGHGGRSEHAHRTHDHTPPMRMRSASTPLAVTTGPAPGPATVSGRSAYTSEVMASRL